MSIDIKLVLSLHLKWLCGEDSGKRADLSGSNLSWSNLSGADLRGSDLSGSNLSWSNLSGSNLSGSNLSGSNLRGADLRGSDLSGSNLSWSNLSRSYLSGADLREADLRGSDLSESNLSEAKDGAVCRMDFGGWPICVRAKKTSIGCQTHNNQKWLDWSPDDVAKMHEDAKEWWSMHGDAVKAAIRCVMEKAKKAKKARRPE